MKAAFVGQTAEYFDWVFGEKQREQLKKRMDFDFSVHTDVSDGALRDTEAIFSTWGMPGLKEEEIREYLPNLREIYYAAGTVQGFARPFFNCGVRIFSAWQANAVPVVQFTFAQILLALKGYFTVQPLTRKDRNAAHDLAAKYPGVFDVKIGLLGCGAIGSRLAEMLKGIDAEVLVFDPFLPDDRAAALGVRKTSLEEIFAVCDVVSNHLASLPSTFGIIRRECFMSMKPYSTFINTGRGPQLNEQDLYDALVEDPTRTALLDVLTNEQTSNDRPLNTLPNCFITPHMAGSGGREVRRMADYMIDAFDMIRSGAACPYEVSVKMLETMA